MSIFKNRSLIKIIAIICIFLTFTNFLSLRGVRAANEEIWGGKLISPIIRLITGIADGVVDLMQKSMMDSSTSLIEIKEKDDNTKRIWVGFACILAVIVVAGMVALGGWAVAGLAAAFGKAIVGVSFVLKTATLATTLGLVAGVTVAKEVSDLWLSKDLQLPAYKVTAEEIFSDEVWLFDVNFFNTDKVYTIKERRAIRKEVSYETEKMFEDSSTTYSSWVKLADVLTEDVSCFGTYFYVNDRNTFDNYNSWESAPMIAPENIMYKEGFVEVIRIINDKNENVGLDRIFEILNTENEDIKKVDMSRGKIVGIGYIEDTTKIIDGEEIPWHRFHYKVKIIKQGLIRYTINFTHDSIDSTRKF